MSDYNTCWSKANTENLLNYAKHHGAPYWIDSKVIFDRYNIQTLPIHGFEIVHGTFSRKPKSPIFPMKDKGKGFLREIIEIEHPLAAAAIMMEENQLCVIDLDDDDPSLAAYAIDVCGPSPLTVKTKRGYHLYYRECPKVKSFPHRSDLYSIDLKCGANSYVVAPFTNGAGGKELYSWLECPEIEWQGQITAFCEALRILPILSEDRLSELFPKNKLITRTQNSPISKLKKAKTTSNTAMSPSSIVNAFPARIIEGRRNNILFRMVMRNTNPSMSVQNILDLAFKLNSRFCTPKLPDDECLSIASSVFKYEQKGRNHIRAASNALRLSPVFISPALWERLNKYPRAMSIFIRLAQHNSPNRIFPFAMDWAEKEFFCSRNTVRKIKKHLVDVNLIEKVSKADKTKGKAECYKFSDFSKEQLGLKPAQTKLKTTGLKSTP